MSIVSARPGWRGNRLLVQFDGHTGVASVKVATSTSTYPASGTGTVVNGQDGSFDAGTFLYSDEVFITITPYPQAAAAGTPGPPHRLRTRQFFIHGFFDDVTGKPKRTQDFTDGKFALKASDTTGKETDDDLFILSTKTVKVGTVASPSVITKTLRVPFGEFIPAADFTRYVATGIYLRPDVLDTTTTFRAPFVLPIGATITAIRLRLYRLQETDTATFTLARVENDALTTIASGTAASGGWDTPAASLTESVTAGRAYTVNVNLLGDNNIDNARLQHVEVDYTVPDYKTTY